MMGLTPTDRAIFGWSGWGCSNVPIAISAEIGRNLCVDSDWAGDNISRKSTSGGAVWIGKQMIKSWSTAQHAIAMSSGEANLYAMVKGTDQTKGLTSMIQDYGIKFNGCVCSDASAAIGMLHRQGLGKTRRIQVQHIWMQSEVADGRVKVEKVGTDVNPARLITKSLPAEKMTYHMERLSFCIGASRAKSASILQLVTSYLETGRNLSPGSI